jgi:hypothetical protein
VSKKTISTKRPNVSKAPSRINNAEKQLNQRLMPRAEELLSRWCEEVRREGDELVMRNPSRDDMRLGSFKFNLKTGKWSDFADPDKFKGHGIVQVYAAMRGVTTAKAIEKLAAEPVPATPSKALTAAPAREFDIQPVDDRADTVPLPPDVHPELGAPSDQYDYREEAQQLVFFVYRFERDGKKETRPVSWSAAKKKWVWKYPPSPWPLYTRGPADADVLVVEGEKTANAAAVQFPHLRVVTSASGAVQAGKSDWSSLKGRNVIISPDNDGAGRGYALAVAGQALAVGAASIKVVDNSRLDWVEGDDLADHEVGVDYLNLAVDVEKYAQAAEREPGIVAAAAQLSIGDYDRAKDRLADSLGIGRRALDALVKAARARSFEADDGDAVDELQFGEVEPWDQAVDGLQLFDELVAAIERHVVLQPGQAPTVALWIMMSWQFERFKILPQLLLSSPLKRCGKTTLLELISYVVNQVLAASNLTGPAVFRAIERFKPTLLIDEADTFLAKGVNSELTGVLNSGHNRALAYVIRVEEVDGERVPMRYSTFAPKVLAMIGTPPETQLDRSVVIEMQRKPKATKVLPLGLNAEQSFHDLKRKLARWRDDTPDSFEHDITACPPLSNDRARQNWSALLSVAKLCGQRAYEQGLEAVELCADTSHLEDDLGADLLADIRSIFKAKKADRLRSAELLKELNDMTDRRWCTSNGGRPMNGHGLGENLRPFKVKSCTFKDGAKAVKGYLRAELEPVFERYLDGEDEQ